jgi:hypothetical protein
MSRDRGSEFELKGRDNTHQIPLKLGGDSPLTVALGVIISGIEAKFCARITMFKL